ncbi:hypothetical protein M885DRAFT_13793 [Pelagophyceae sp. CCMP2097]|nr:hypothetical protein M885DRAFT_13793 [Pelagophyceae sp. CCMP2097]
MRVSALVPRRASQGRPALGCVGTRPPVRMPAYPCKARCALAQSAHRRTTDLCGPMSPAGRLDVISVWQQGDELDHGPRRRRSTVASPTGLSWGSLRADPRPQKGPRVLWSVSCLEVALSTVAVHRRSKRRPGPSDSLGPWKCPCKCRLGCIGDRPHGLSPVRNDDRLAVGPPPQSDRAFKEPRVDPCRGTWVLLSTFAVGSTTSTRRPHPPAGALERGPSPDPRQGRWRVTRGPSSQRTLRSSEDRLQGRLRRKDSGPYGAGPGEGRCKAVGRPLQGRWKAVGRTGVRTEPRRMAQGLGPERAVGRPMEGRWKAVGRPLEGLALSGI